MLRCIALLLPLVLAVACTTSVRRDSPVLMPGDPYAPSQVTPSEAMAIAQNYATHPWQPFARNIRHGNDAKGVLVHTPDVSLQTPPERPGWWVPGEVNRGIPYKWGGFDEPGRFDQAVAEGLAAGDVSSPEKRRLDNAAVSAEATGVDCSGFVSRCLKLPTVHDTARLPEVCRPLDSAAELRPGDVMNIPKRHVILCAGWATPDHTWIYYYETGGPPDYWKPALKQAPLASLLELGYTPLRYLGMAQEPTPSGKEVLSRAVRSQAAVVLEPVIGEP